MKLDKRDLQKDLSNLGCENWAELHQVLAEFGLEDDTDKIKIPIKYQDITLFEVKELLKFYRQLDAGQFKRCFRKLRHLSKENGLIDEEIDDKLQELYPEDRI
jgi:hypothetical protein